MLFASETKIQSICKLDVIIVMTIAFGRVLRRRIDVIYGNDVSFVFIYDLPMPVASRMVSRFNLF